MFVNMAQQKSETTSQFFRKCETWIIDCTRR